MVVELLVLWTKSLGFIWDIQNNSTKYNYWALVQSRRSKSSFLGGYVLRIGFLKLFNNDKKCNKNSTVNKLVVEKIKNSAYHRK